MEKKIILIIRRHKDYWLKNEICKIKIQSYVFRLMELWDSFFDFKIIDFRNKMRDIASSTYMKNKFDEIHLYSHIDPGKIKEKNELKNKLYKNSIIVPIDEDDWISPNLAEILREIKTEEQFFVWNYYKTWNGQTQKAFPKDRGRGWTKISCVWAIKGYENFLKRHNHLKVSEEEFKQIYFINKILSVRVSHVGTIGYLKKVVKQNWEKEEEWEKSLIKKIKTDIETNIEPPKIFQNQWIQYKKTLKELLDSRKNV